MTQQLSFFKRDADTSSVWKIYTDGASRGNPGPAGAGIFIVKDNDPFCKASYYLGIKTNNQAEYLALLIGLYLVKHHIKRQDKLIIYVDSQLLQRQVSNIYKIKNSYLKKIYEYIKEELALYDYSIEHVLRENNTVADELANKAVDQKVPVPQELTVVHSFIESL